MVGNLRLKIVAWRAQGSSRNRKTRKRNSQSPRRARRLSIRLGYRADAGGLPARARSSTSVHSLRKRGVGAYWHVAAFKEVHCQGISSSRHSLTPMETWVLDARETLRRFKVSPSAVWHIDTDDPGSAARAIVLIAAISSRYVFVVDSPTRAHRNCLA